MTTGWEAVFISTPPTVRVGDDVAVQVRLRNTGTMPGERVIEVYLSRSDGADDRPVRWLAAAASVSAAPGQIIDVVITVPALAFGHGDAASSDRGIEPGVYRLQIGWSSRDLGLRTTVRLI